MTVSPPRQGVMPREAIRRLGLGLTLGVAGLAGLVLLATFLGLPALAALGRGQVPMSPLAAGLVLLLCGALLLMSVQGGSAALRHLACGLAWVVALLNLGFLAGHVQGEPLAFERWLTQARPQMPQMPQMPLTSLLTNLALLSAALSVLFQGLMPRATWALRQTAALLALLPLLIGAVVLISYAAGAPLLYGTGHIPMAMPTALCCLALGLALSLAAGTDTWPLATFKTGPGQARGWTLFGVSAGALTVFLFVGTLALVGGSLVLRGQIQTARVRIDEQLKSIAEFKSQQISTWYLERRSDVEILARSELIQTPVRRFLAGSPQAPSEAEVRAWMGEFLKGAYARVVLFDGQGRVRVAVPAEHAPVTDVIEASEIQQALRAKDVLIEDLHVDSAFNNIHMSYWVPIRTGGSDPKAAGALLLVLDPRQFLYPLIQSWPTVSATSETLLVRRDGDDVLFLNDLRHLAHTALQLRFPLATNSTLPAARAVLGQQDLLEGSDYRGVPVLSVVKTISGTPWHMVAKVDEVEIYGPLRQRVWAGGLGLMGILGLFGVGLGMLLRYHDAGMIQKQLSLAQRFELIMREANDMFFLTDDRGAILEANLRAVECYGYEQAELLDMNILEVRDSESPTEGQDLFDLTKMQRSLRFDSVHRRKDGRAFPVEVSARTLSLDGEMRVIIFVRDITERQTQQAELVRMTQLYSALSQVNQAIVWAPTQGDLLNRICEVMVEFGRFDLAWVGLTDPLTQQVSVAAKYGDTTGYLARIQVESLPSRLGSGPVGTAIREGCPFVENNFLGAVETEPWHAAAAESGLRSMAAFPIRQAGLVIGALAVYSKEKDFFGPSEAALLEEAAVDVSFAVDHLAGEDQRRSTELALLESERLLTEAQEAGGVGTYTWFIREDHWRSSAYLDQIFGITPDYPRNLEGWTGLVAPHFQDAMQAYVGGIIERHERFDLDYPIIRVSDGALRWVHGQGDILRDAEGQPLAMVGIIQDITDRKAAEGMLRRISVAVEQSPLSIVITNPQATIEYVNPAFTRVTGYTAEEAIGQNPRILKSVTTPPEVYQKMWQALTRGEVWVGELDNLKKNGELFHERATITPVHDEAGVLVNYIAFKEDITQLKRDEDERHSLASQLHQSQKLESLGSLAGGVAHDMNNVLGAILGLASTLRETADPQSPALKSLDTIMNACLRGRGVVKSLLYFAKKDLQEERLIDLNDLVKEMTQLLSHTTLKRVLLSLDLQEGIALLRGDPGALSHALMNLCVNAMDAMPSGGTLQITTGQSEDGGLRLSVRDTGEGMSPEVLAKAMEPFFTTKPHGKGTGLGLAMVYGTMTAHEGVFDLSSQPGQGTEAMLRFPAHRVEALVSAPAVAPTAAPVVGDHLSILLVDDDELIREAITPLLEVLGHAVTAVPGGREALQWLESGKAVDLVILDMNMPGMGGAEALPLILALRPGLSVIMASGYSDEEIAPLLVGHPTVSSLRKPFTLKEVQEAISALQLGVGLPPAVQAALGTLAAGAELGSPVNPFGGRR